MGQLLLLTEYRQHHAYAEQTAEGGSQSHTKQSPGQNGHKQRVKPHVAHKVYCHCQIRQTIMSIDLQKWHQIARKQLPGDSQ